MSNLEVDFPHQKPCSALSSMALVGTVRVPQFDEHHLQSLSKLGSAKGDVIISMSTHAAAAANSPTPPMSFPFAEKVWSPNTDPKVHSAQSHAFLISGVFQCPCSAMWFHTTLRAESQPNTVCILPHNF
eukprot:c16164_g1_i5.p1 GENE.c16164_g1_i5~~c16164_g1_i5.p1  ORF type:complete len:129 (+),score=14.92 c16164_g1_i5:187-573(+)